MIYITAYGLNHTVLSGYDGLLQLRALLLGHANKLMLERSKHLAR